METGLFSSSRSDDLLVGPFSETETSVILEILLKTINAPFRKNEPVPKTILVDFFGTQKSMKTTVTGKIEQVFRRHKFKSFCPPETAEIEKVRNLLSDNPDVEQLKHLTGVQDYLLNLTQHPRCHVAIISRGPKDMLYWYERGLRRGDFTESHVERVRNFIYELLKLDLIDSFFFFTCSVETAMRRGYDGALTQRRGSKMNEKDVAETIDIYHSVLRGVRENVPGLPVFHIDTSDMGVKEAGEEVLKFLLPTVCARFNVPISRVMPRNLSLIRRHILLSEHFEEQIKFIGHPEETAITACGWDFSAEYTQEDTYLNPNQDGQSPDPFGEVMRIRRDELGIKFMYKGNQGDRILSHRLPCSFPVDETEVEELQAVYSTVIVLKKKRRCFEMAEQGFTLHLDDIEGLGKFTEIRAKGSLTKTNIGELLKLASRLGFSIDSMIEGNYFSLALKRQTP